MVGDLTPFLASTRFIDADHASIRSVVSGITEGTQSRRRTAARLFRFVRDTVRYDPWAPMLDPDDYVASTVLARGHGFCVQKAVLLAALSRCAGVPCRLGFSDVRNHLAPPDLTRRMGTDLFVFHGYVEFFLNDRWIKAVPAFDRATCAKHGHRLVEFDGEYDALLPETDLSGRPHFEYVAERGVYADVPYDEILRAFADTYGAADPEFLPRKDNDHA